MIMFSKYSLIIGVSLLALQIVQITSKVELTNLKCIPLDESFAKFEYCRIKSVNRTYKYFSVKVNLLKVPVKNVTVNVTALKRLNGYKPFLYNITLDACKYLTSTNKNPVFKYFHGLIVNNSNMNHSCPYDHDLFVDKVSVESLHQKLRVLLPVPDGDYAVYTSWYAYGINRADVRIYGTLS